MRYLLLLSLLFKINISECQVPARPKIVIGLVIDQMRWDYLYRFYDRYSEDGFRKLLTNGYNFQNTKIPFAPTVTSSGHASIYTGTVPAIHGITGNDWIERFTNTPAYSCTDKNVSGVGTSSAEGQMSPVNLLATTIGDELRLATNFRSRVFGISLKNRGGILAAGRSANDVYWLDDITGNWISSSWYMQDLPEWVKQFNRERWVDSLLNSDWNTIYPFNTYTSSTTDDSPFEKTLPNEKTVTFPHLFKNRTGKDFSDLRYNPNGNTFTFKMAEQLIVKEKAGKINTDMLCISLSSTDYIGHKFGVNSVEIEDTYLRLDKDLADFLSFLDKYFGKDYLLFLSADHGGSQAAGWMEQNKISSGSLNSWKLPAELNATLKNITDAKIVTGVLENQVYFNHHVIDSLHLDLSQIKKKLTTYLLSKKQILNVLDYEHPEQWKLPENFKQAFIHGYYQQRCGDLQIILKPQVSDNSNKGTEHGGMYNYDSHIPLIFYGWNIPKGNVYREVYMIDIAPTICSLLHIQMPNGSVGKILTELFK